MDLAIIILCVLLVILSIKLFNKADTLNSINEELKDKNNELKELRRQEVSNNTLLLEHNRKVQKILVEISNIVNSKITLIDKEDKIKELLSNIDNNRFSKQ